MKIASVVLSLFGAASLAAQISGGSITGNVTDSSGSSIPSARVAARNTGTNQTDQTVTNATGYYEFPLLPVGRYVITVENTGFQTTESKEFALSAGTRPRIDFTLQPAGVTQTVDVTATAPLVNATTTDLGVVIENRKIEALPLNGRNFLQLVGLQAGVVNAPGSSTGGRGGIEFNGSPALGNNLMLDGVDMSFGENNGAAGDTAAGAGTSGALIQGISVEAIEEFKATGSAFSAEYGRATGGVLNVVTRSGTNDFHGTLFEFFRNDALDANSYFSNRSGLSKPPLRWNQFGGNFGGPVKRDRVFFFGNYEGAIVRRNEQVTGNVPTPALLNQVTPPIRTALEGMPAPTEPTANPLIGFHRRNDARRNDEHTFLGRIDTQLRSHRLSVRYSHNHQDFSEPTLLTLHRQTYPQRFHNAVVQDVASIAPTVVNEFRVGFNRNDLDRHFTDSADIPAWIGNIPSVGMNPGLVSYIHYISNTYTLADNLTVIRGSHTWKFGTEIREVRSGRIQGNQPTHNYNTLDDLIADRATTLTLIFGGGKNLKTTNYAFYAQDDWRLTSRVQLNLGLRYEYYPPLVGAFNINTRDPFGPYGDKTEPMYKSDRNNFAPRAGLVWDVTGNQKLIVRTGGALTYGPPQPFFYYDMSFIDPKVPFNATLNPRDLPPGTSIAFPFPYSFVNAVAADPSLLPPNFILSRSVMDYGRQDEYAGQWNVSVQRAVTSSLAVQGSYVGSRGINLYSTRNLNLFDPVLAQRPRPEFGDVNVREHIGRSEYHSLQLQANQRFSRGFAFDVYYTFGKTTAYSAPDTTLVQDTNVQDPYNIAGSNGPKAGEARHRLVAVGSYAIPLDAWGSQSRWVRALAGGWQIQSIFTARTGGPVNIVAGRDMFGNRRVDGQRPDLVAGVDQYVNGPDELLWLNRAAFDIETPTRERRFGNLGYNALRGPGAINVDAAIHRTFAIAEGHRLTFRFEAFNAFNHFNPGNPNTTVSNPNFGRILGGSGGRNVQIALKYQF